MPQIEVNQADGQLSELLEQVASGKEIVLTVTGQPVAKLVSVAEGRDRVGGQDRVLGQDAGAFEIPEDFDDPLPEFEEYSRQLVGDRDQVR